MSEAKTVKVSAEFKSEDFLKRLTSAAQSTHSSLPTQEELAGLDEATQRLYNRTSGLLEGILSTPASEWTDESLISMAKEVGWAHTGMQLAASARSVKGGGFQPAIPKGGGGTGKTVTDCANDYSGCIKENGCKGGVVCLCCVPCSLQYAGCIKSVILGKQSPVATLFDLNGRWAFAGVPGPSISVVGNSLSVDMTAYKRPVASGYITDGSDIVVNFPDDHAYSAKLKQPNIIIWSNNSTWTKV